MKLFTFRYGKLTQGITETTHEHLGRVLRLGERGRGRWEALVTIHRDLPDPFDECHPIVRERIVNDHPVQAVLLVPARAPHNDVLVRVCTDGPYTRHTYGVVKHRAGIATRLAHGWGAAGDAGRLGTWDDDLWQLSPDALLDVKLFGGSKSGRYALFVRNAQPVAMRWEEYEIMQTLQEDTP